MGEAWRIAPLADDDIAAVIELAEIIWRHHFSDMISMEQIEHMLARRYTPAIIRAQMHRADAWWDKALADGRLIGFAQYELQLRGQHAPAMKLNQIYVHQACQRRGYGGHLLAHVEQRALGQGCGAVRLNVNRHNIKAIAAYRKYGYVTVEAAVADIGGGFVTDDYVMEKKL